MRDDKDMSHFIALAFKAVLIIPLLVIIYLMRKQIF